MKKLLISILAIFSSFFITNVSASTVDIQLSSFTYDNRNMLDMKWYGIGHGNSTLAFDFDFVKTDANAQYLYTSIVLCSDSTYSSSYASDPSEITNIQINNTNYSCTYSNSGYTGGKVVIINILAYSSGANSIVIYQNDDASIQLIDFAVDSSSYVNPMNYSSQTAINQNSNIINQNTQIINQNDIIINQGKQTNDNLNDLKDKQDQTNQKIDDVKGTLNDDSIDTSQSDSFFDGFNNEDNLLTSVVLFPIQILNNVDATCTPLSLPFESDKMKASDYSLPCGDTLFWNKPKVSEFKKFWNFIVGAPIIYGCLLWSFKTIQKLKNPFDNEVEMIEL